MPTLRLALRCVKLWSCFAVVLLLLACDDGSGPSGLPTATPIVQFAASSQIVAENSGAVTATVRLSAASREVVTVPFIVTGTATQGEDFSCTPSPLTIPAGDTSAAITITLVNDGIGECPETIILSLDSATNAVDSGVTVQTITVADDDTVPVSDSGMTVTSPNGCETYYVGDTMNITWTIPVKNFILIIDFSPDNGLTWHSQLGQVYTSDPNYSTGPYRWEIPDTIYNTDGTPSKGTVSDSCLIKVREYLAPPLHDQSDRVFSIKARP